MNDPKPLPQSQSIQALSIQSWEYNNTCSSSMLFSVLSHTHIMQLRHHHRNRTVTFDELICTASLTFIVLIIMIMNPPHTCFCRLTNKWVPVHIKVGTFALFRFGNGSSSQSVMTTQGSYFYAQSVFPSHPCLPVTACHLFFL
jgi:hypothetical protein